jgi:dethiobiotin synthetase
MKPVETGIDGAHRVHGPSCVSDADRSARRLRRRARPVARFVPIALVEPLAPMVAAQRAGRTLDLAALDRARDTRTPITTCCSWKAPVACWCRSRPRCHYADLFARWQCELIIVAGNRLGVLNHVLLTVQAARVAWTPGRVPSCSRRSATRPHRRRSDELRRAAQLLPHIRCLRFPWVDRVDDSTRSRPRPKAAGSPSCLSPSV